MGTYTLSEALAGAVAQQKPRRPAKSGARHVTGAPVLRDSIESGTFEQFFFVAPIKGETDRLLRVARRMVDVGRQLRSEARLNGRDLSATERLLTTLTSGSVRVFEEILTLARLNKGQVFPSYDYLAAATCLGRATVARALRILEQIGFLVRQRRFKRIEAEGPGPRYRQTSNAYRPLLPKTVLKFLPRWMRPVATPDDVLQHEAERVDAIAHMQATLSNRELADSVIDGSLAKVLARLGAAIERKERESHNNPQPLMDSYKTGFKSVGLISQHVNA